ncbi:uncharacterized protein LOC134696533 [Mytilus trossulus]|uniref:uncharacterized protein LOC134696533 n=1 Tax=Mytilus trossulus TaxID=6551 RepID=UPI0030047E6F
MSMLVRTGTVVRKNRRRSSSKGSTRRGSAPTVLQPTAPSPSSHLGINQNVRTYLTPQPSPSKSVNFSFDSERMTASGANSRQHSIVSEKPSNYGSVVLWKDTSEPDFSFNLMSNLCEAMVEADGTCDFIQRAFLIVCGTWPVTVLTGVLMSMPIAMMIIGVKYLEDCPKERKLPIYLLVGGCFGTIKLTLMMCSQIRLLNDEDDEDYHDDNELATISRMANVGLTIFLSIWFVFGNCWFFDIWIPNFRSPLHEPKNWCDKTVFNFTYYHLIVCHTIIGIALCLAFLFCCCFTCVKCSNDVEKG